VNAGFSHYQPFIDDATHRAELNGQRFVVLRMPPAVARAFGHMQDVLRQKLVGAPVSYPARAHVTLCGFAAGVSLDDVQEETRAWAHSTPSLLIELEGLSVFPTPFQIVLVQVRRTPELFAALAGLRQRAERRGLTLSTVVPAEQWIFHMSLAYCKELSAPAWHEVTQLVDTVHVPPAACVVGEAEVVGFDDGKEYSGGVFPLN
jgi:2'-5' RNA ligase